MPPKKKGRRRFGSPQLKNGRYFIVFTGPDAKRHSAGQSFATKRQAEQWAAKEEAHIDACRAGYATWVPPRERTKQQQVNATTVDEYLQQFNDRLLAHDEIKLSTYQKYMQQIENRISREDLVTGDAGLLRNMPLTVVTKTDVQLWWDAIRHAYPDTPTANRHAYVRLRAAFKDAAERDLIAGNPVAVAGAERAAAPKHDRPLLTDEELRALYAVAPARYRVLTLLVFFHGLRIGEALGVKVGNVVVEPCRAPWLPQVTVQVRGQLQRLKDDNDKTVMRYQSPKTSAGVRDVPVFAEFVPDVLRHMCRYAAPGTDGWLTVTSRGSTVFDTSYRKTLGDMREQAGITRRVHPHAGRRWIVTRLAEAGATPAEIGQVLGDKDLATITQIYTQVRQGRPRELMDRIGSTLQGMTEDREKLA